MREVRVGVAGLGTVGKEAVRLLLERRGELGARLGAEVRVAAVCDRQVAREAARLGLGGAVSRCRDPRRLLGEPLDIVVETLGGLGDARRLVLGALSAGRHVVTANKRLLAHHWDEVVAAARRSGAGLRFEASVAGGIPILEAVQESLAANRIHRVLGILNGTTNFILTRMAHDGSSLEAALAEAQRLGLAERDPSLDLDGTDAAHKVCVIASLLAGRWVRPGEVPHEGISGLTPSDLAYAAKELGRAARLLGIVEVEWPRGPGPAGRLPAPRVAASVRPTLVPLDHPLAAVHGEYNAVMVQGSPAGDLMFYGKGAGAGPAASAVVGDVLKLARDVLRRPAAYPTAGGEGGPAAAPGAGGPATGRRRGSGAAARGETSAAGRPPRPAVIGGPGQGRSAFYLRFDVADRPGVLSRITGALGSRGVSIARIYQEEPRASSRGAVPRAPVFIATHPAAEASLEAARRAILRFPFVSPSHACLRML